MAADASYVVRSYADYLLSQRQRKLYARFQQMRRNAPESALAEALVFRALQACKVNPAVVDKPGKGGPDFLCLAGTPQQFMVEATSLLPERITKETAIPNRFPEDMEGGAFGLLTAQIDETATKKMHQFKGIGMPGILAIASTHFGAPLVMNAMAAENTLVSQPFWVAGQEGMSTDLAYALFLRGEDGAVVPKNTGISAILFVAVGTDRSYVCGSVSPCAMHRFNPVHLWEIPFAYLKDWPVEKNRLRLAWTLGSSPKPLEIPHAAIR